MLFVWLALATIIPAFALSVLAVAGVRRLAIHWKLVDTPSARKNHAHPIPLGGGIGIWLSLIGCFALGSLATLLVPADYSSGMLPKILAEHRGGLVQKLGDIWILLAGGTILMLLGLADDRRGIPWYVRLVVELAVAAAVVLCLGLRLTAFIGIPWLTSILSILWIVALINSFNMLDNMDGLSGGVASIASFILAAVLLISPDPIHQQPQLFVAAMSLVLCGSLLGFLVHNWPPAKIFMGDAGSYLVGYWLAVSTLLATYTGYRTSHPQAILAPLFILAIPLYDMTSVLWIRIREGRSLFQADRRHFSHRLVQLGMSKKQAVFTIYLATTTCGLAAFLLPRTDLMGACVAGTMVVCVLSLIAVLENLSRSRDD